MPFTSTPINVLDAAGTSKSVIAYNDGTSSAFAHPILDETGNIISPATAGKQDTGNSALATIATNTTGLATAAAQSTGNTSLASVATNTGTTNTNLGAQADSAASTDTGTFSLIALMKRGLQNWTTLQAKIPSLVSNRVPVDGSGVTQPVSAASLPLPSGAATSANQSTANTSLATIATNTTSIATAANQATANSSLASIATNTTNANTKLDTLATEIAKLYQPRITATASFTRPANTTAYSANDLMANSTTAGSVTPLTFVAARANDIPGKVVGGRFFKSGNTTTFATFRLHFFKTAPTVTNGDNGALAITSTMTDYLGRMDVTCAQVVNAGAFGELVPFLNEGVAFTPDSGTQNIYALVEAMEGYTPASGETFTIDLEIR